jgi:aminoglycoside phosphotransferase family enzyme
MADPKFKKSLLNTLKTHLSFSNLYDCFSFEDAMGSIDIIKDICDTLEVKNQEASKKLMIEHARELLIENGYTVS